MTLRFMAKVTGWLVVPFIVMGNRGEQTLKNNKLGLGHVEV